MRTAFGVLLLLTALSAPAGSQDAADGRTPVPDSAAQKKAEKKIRDIFKDDYAKSSPADRVALAKEMIKQAIETSDDAAVQFVLLREARDLAAKAWNLDTAFRAVDEMERNFQVNASEMKLAVLGTVAPAVKEREDLRRVANAYLHVADDAVAADDYESALKAAGSASSLAKRAKDMTFAAKAEARARDIDEIKGKYDAARRAREKLAADPGDAAANLAVGRFLCLFKGDWEAGLPYLEKGSDSDLSSLAAQESGIGNDGTQAVEVADVWWDRAAKEKGTARDNMRSHAAECYQRALDSGLQGLVGKRVEKRLIDWRRERGGGWEDVTNPALFGLEGAPAGFVEVTPKSSGAGTARLQRVPPGDFDGVSVSIRFPSGRRAVGHVSLDADWLFGVHSENQNVTINEWVDGKWKIKDSASISRSSEYVLAVLLVDGNYVVSVNGETKLKLRAQISTITQLTLQADYESVVFDEIKLRYKVR